MAAFHDHSDVGIIEKYNNNQPTLNISVEEYRQELSDRMAITLLPAILVLGVLMVLGLVGNTLVFYVYLKKVPTASATRPMILALALYDLITCLISIPGEILDIRYSFNFMSDALCKMFRLSTTFLLIASGMTLLLVALDRYQRICHPLRKHTTYKMAWWRVAGACAVAIALSILAPLVNAKRQIETPMPGVTGMECSTDPAYKKVAFVWHVLLSLVFLIAFTFMIIAYIFIGRRVFRQNQFRIEVQQKQSIRAVSMEFQHKDKIHKDASLSCDFSSPDDIGNEFVIKSSDRPAGDTDEENTGNCTTPNLERNGPSLSRKPSVFKTLRSSSLDATTRRTTLMLFLITIIFVLSFMPHIIISILQAATKSLHSYDTSDTNNIIYNIFVRSYFLNTAANPFIYGFCSLVFRRECKELIRGFVFWRRNEN